MRDISRRLFGKVVATSAASAFTGLSVDKLDAELPLAEALGSAFPKGFLWGCATAAYQIEGAVAVDGRGSSVWDTFSHLPGKTHDGDTGDIAADSYHRYKEDVQLLKALGVQTYRMSLSWSRIFPTGIGDPNAKGVDHYSRVIDELLANNITPYITLFHWDLPQALPGGWQSRETAKAFADYAAYATKRYGDRVHHWITTNEFSNFTDEGYRTGTFAPGLRLADGPANQVRHHGILAHGLGVQAIRANSQGATQVGLAQNVDVFVPVIGTPEHIQAARRATRDYGAAFMTPVMEGKYPDEYLQRAGANAPKAEPGDMEAISSRLDFVGLNIYTPNYVRAEDNGDGYIVENLSDSYPHMASSWIKVGPECLYWGVRNVYDLWHPPAIYITENGTSCEDTLIAGGRVDDIDRVMYLRNHLTQLHRATAEGYPVKGYFLWSLLDNFEWADGYSKRFGIYYVDYKTEKRTPKLSAEWYKQVIAQNTVL